jgi:GGDEF domain-containing protein
MHFGRSAALIKEIGEASVEAMMQQLGQTICAHIRQNDIAVRYQATIIALLLADTDQKNAFFVVDKFRKLLSHTRVPNTDRMVTMAAGIAEAVINPDYDSVDVVTEVINRAEGALDLAINSEPNSARALAAEVPTAAVA